MFRPEAILFDVDGTLIDTFRLYLESYRRALAPLLGRAPEMAELIARPPLSERRFLSHWVEAEELESCHAAMCDHYRQLLPSLAGGVYEGVREMLAGLRSADIRLGIVTGKGRTVWDATKTLLDSESFEVVITEDDVGPPKPDPAGLLAALSSMGIEPSAAIYIGDSASDMQTGRAAGTRIGAALWPKDAPGEREEFLQRIASFQPDWVFERPADVVRAFAPWC